MTQSDKEMMTRFAIGDLVSTNFAVGIVFGKEDPNLIHVRYLIDGKNEKAEPDLYCVDEITKDFCPKQETIFEAMYGAPNYVEKLFAKNVELSKDSLPTAEYMAKHLSQCAYMTYYKDYFLFLYNLNPVPLDKPEKIIITNTANHKSRRKIENPNLLRSCLKHCPPATQNLETILFLLEHGAIIDAAVYEQLVYLYSKMSKNSKKDFPLINKILIHALEQGMNARVNLHDPGRCKAALISAVGDPFCSLVNHGNATFVDEKGNDLSDPVKKYTLFKLSIKFCNYQLYDYLTSNPKIVNDPRFKEASALPEEIIEWAKRIKH
jgi:hypothetical protein